MRINVIANIYREDALAATQIAADWMAARDIRVLAEMETAARTKIPLAHTDEFSDADLVIAFGGDGTLIRAAQLCSLRGTPILGVYYGRFGFVTQCKGDELPTMVQAFLAGEAKIESRMMLQAELIRGKNSITEIHALNELVLQRSVTARLMTYSVTIDGITLTSYPADGVIVSTATGSTGYALSAGGPILDPNVQAMLLTALAPHTLSARPLILRPDSVIELAVQSDGDSVFSADGQTRLHILKGDRIRVKQSPRVTNLVSVEKNDFLLKLRQLLFWSHSVIGDEE